MMELSALTNVKEQVLTSLKQNTQEEKIMLYNAMNQAEEALIDHVNQVITVKDFIAHTVKTQDDNGTENNAVRVILINDKGKSYASVSSGITSSLSKIFSIFGTPDTWEKPMKFKVLQKKSKSSNTNKYLSLEIV